MIKNNRLIVTGTKNNSIYIAIYKIDDKSFILEKIDYLSINNTTMLHSCIVDNDNIFILDCFNNNIIKYNMKNKLYCDCNTGKDPRHLCRCCDYLYVTNFESDSLSIIDADKLYLTGTISVGVKPHDIVADVKKQKLYIACYEENHILEYDIISGEKRYMIMEGKPMHLIISNNYLFTLSYLPNDDTFTEINVINLNSLHIVKTFLIEEISTNFIFDEDTKELFVVAIKSGIVYSINILKDIIKKQIHLSGYLEDLSVNDKYLFVANSDRNCISIFDKVNFNPICDLQLEFIPAYIKLI